MSRTDLEIKDAGIIFVVVGMRLPNVVDDLFIDMIDEIIEEPNAHILFVGHFNSFDNIFKKHPCLKGRVTFAGFHDDIMSIYDVCDVYINPKQPGGGSAIVYAMSAGLPALSLRYGDGGLAVEKLPEIKNYRELAVVAKKLCVNREFYDQYKKITRDAVAELPSRRPLIENILRAFSDYQKNNLQSQITLQHLNSVT